MLSLSAPVLLMLLFATPLAGTTVRTVPWWELVSTADFIGTIKCTKAGGLVSEHEVVSCWLGDEQTGKKLRVYESPNYWGTQFPVCLAERTYFLVAYKNRAPATVMSTSAGGAVPLWWRNLQYDYRNPLGIPFWEVDEPTSRLEIGAKEFENLAAAEQSVRDFTKLTAGQQEAVRLREDMVFKLEEHRYSGWDLEDCSKEQVEFTRSFARTLADLVETTKILDLVARHAKDDKGAMDENRFYALLRDAGGIETLSWLGHKEPADVPLSREDRADLVKELTNKCLPQLSDLLYPDDAKKRDSLRTKRQAEREEWERADRALRADVEKLRRIFKTGEEHDDWAIAFEELCKRDPGVVADWLKTWDPEEGRFSYMKRERAYAIASWFGSACGTERAKHLSALLDAKDRTVRVSAAVYLCFDDEQAGTKALSEMTKEDDLDSLWAALTLARRGHKDVMPRLFELIDMKADDQTGMSDEPQEVLSLGVLVLLSNSCAASGVSQPPNAEAGQTLGKTWRKWWDKNADKITLSDPWLAELAEQRID